MIKNDDRCELIKKIVLTTLGAVISVTLIFPLLLKLSFIKKIFERDSKELFIGISAIILAILLFSWEKMNLYWKRYRATKETGKFPLVSIDFIFIYIFLVAVLVFVFRTFEGIKISKEFGNFLWVLLIVFLIFFFICLVLSIKGLRGKKKSGKNDNEGRLSSDDPITSAKQDILRRGKFVDDLSKIIVNLPSALACSFTIGLNGSWGEGKTSVINLLIEKLENDNVVIIQFDPWYFGGEEAILNAFYDQLEKAFSEKFIFPGFKKSIARYLKLISTGVSLSGIKFDIHSPAITIEKTKEQIESYIKKVGKKVVIIIDDIDRLQPDEMALVFKLVRQNTNFKNTIFLLSFNESVVKKILEDKIGIDGDFLDKIINMPIPLPTIEQRSIDGYLLDKIEKILKDIAIPSDEAKSLKDEFQEIYKSGISELFKTLRVTKRYLNSLSSTLPSIKSEVNPRDFLILEIIKVFNADLFNKLSKHQWLLVPTFIEQLSLEAEDAIETKLKKPSSYNNRGDFMIASLRKQIDSLLIYTNDKEKEIFQTLLSHLFPEIIGEVLNNKQPDLSRIEKDRNKKKISHPESFPKYFLLQVPSLEIPDEQVEAMISIWESMESKGRKESIKQELFKKDIEGKAWTSKWIAKLMDFNELIDSPLALSIIEVIYENAAAFTRGQNDLNWRGTEFSKAAWLMVFLIKDKIGKQSKAEVLEDALMKTPDLLFSCFIIKIWKEESLEGESISATNSIDLKPLKDKVIQRVQENFIDKKIDIFEKYVPGWSFILYRWGTHWGERDGQFSEIIQDYVLSLVKYDAVKFYNFLYEMANKSPEIFPKVEFQQFKKWYNVTKFKEIALKFKDNESLSAEKKELISQFLDSVPDQPQLSQE